MTIDLDAVRDALGRQRHFQESAIRTAVPGVATGLAVTGAGGDVLFVEATAMQGKPGLTLTGQLGDVMKESAQIALSYVRGHADELGIDAGRVRGAARSTSTCPAGAIPKDGPSAGVTMVTALTSLLSDRPVRHTVGMTGEVTLQGRVLPIGGVKQKVLAAHAAGLTDVVLPERNRGDLDDVPEEVRDAMKFHFAMTIDEVLGRRARARVAARRPRKRVAVTGFSARRRRGVGCQHEHDHRPGRAAGPRPGPEAAVHRRRVARRAQGHARGRGPVHRRDACARSPTRRPTTPRPRSTPPSQAGPEWAATRRASAARSCAARSRRSSRARTSSRC